MSSRTSLPNDTETLHSVSSVGSSIHNPRSLYEDRQDQDDERDVVSRVYSNIISRTTSVVKAVIDENQLTREFSEHHIPPEPFEVLDNADERNSSRDVEKHLKSDQFDDMNEQTTSDGEYNGPNTGEYNADDLKDLPPDGTFWGWTATVCNMLINCCSWGSNSAFSVYLNYYLQSGYFKGASAEDYALIGGLTLGLAMILCPFAVLLCRKYPLKWILSAGLVVEFCCYIFGSFSKTYGQLVVTQGVLLAFGYALVAGPTFLILPGWFLKKRSIAQGISTAGGGLGGIMFGKSSSAIIEKTGNFQWGIRMIGFVSAFFIIISIILLRPRKQLHDRNASLLKELRGVINMETSCSYPILCISWWFFVYSFGYSILLFSLSAFATSIGLTASQGSTIVTIQGAAQCIGRPVIGILSDKTGRINFCLFGCTIVGIFSLAFWPFITTFGQLIGFTVVVGFLMGVNWVNFAPLAADAVGAVKFPAAFTSICICGGVPSVVAEVIGLKIRVETSSKPFFWCQMFVGITTFVGLMSLLPLREWKIKNMITARRQNILNQSMSSQNQTPFDSAPKTEEEIMSCLNSQDRTRLERYNFLLGDGPHKFILRMLYPVKA